MVIENFRRGCLSAGPSPGVGFEHLAVAVDSAPKVMRLSADRYEYLIPMPAPLFDPAHHLGSPLTDLIGKIASRTVDPQARAFVAKIYALLMEKVFDIPQ